MKHNMQIRFPEGINTPDNLPGVTDDDRGLEAPPQALREAAR